MTSPEITQKLDSLSRILEEGENQIERIWTDENGHIVDQIASLHFCLREVIRILHAIQAVGTGGTCDMAAQIEE